MEVGEAVLALDLVNAKLDFPEGVLVVLVEVGERQLEDAALERVVGVLCEGAAEGMSLRVWSTTGQWGEKAYSSQRSG